jgi:hypothetical protein
MITLMRLFCREERIGYEFWMKPVKLPIKYNVQYLYDSNFVYLKRNIQASRLR